MPTSCSSWSVKIMYVSISALESRIEGRPPLRYHSNSISAVKEWKHSHVSCFYCRKFPRCTKEWTLLRISPKYNIKFKYMWKLGISAFPILCYPHHGKKNTTVTKSQSLSFCFTNDLASAVVLIAVMNDNSHKKITNDGYILVQITILVITHIGYYSLLSSVVSRSFLLPTLISAFCFT